jgi:hypothetical protein
MVAKKKKGSPGANSARDAANASVDAGAVAGAPVYIGIDSGSDLETYGYQSQLTHPADPYATTGPASFASVKTLATKPKYKVGYLNSEDFARELGNKNPDIIYIYQQRMAAAGLLDAYTPGQLDKPTKAAFKELLSGANQIAGTWQQALQDTETVGGRTTAPKQERDPFVAKLDDPATLRETFQSAVQKIYGGDLPDDEINAMVDAYRSQQLSKQQAYYDAQPLGGAVTTETDPTAYALAEVKAKHPQQLDRVKFQDTFSQIMSAFGSGAR